MIQSPLLQSLGHHINGQWLTTKTDGVTTVTNPFNGAALAEIPHAGVREIQTAIDAGRAAMMQTHPLDQRQAWLHRIADAIDQHREELGRIITLEQGKPHPEAIGEADYAAGFYRHAAEHIDWLKPETLPGRPRDCRWSIHHRPAGVVGLITPWNFPLAMLAKKLSAALAAGCGSVTKPASQTPLTAIAFWSLLEQIELPPGLANLVIGPAGPIGKTFCEHPAIRAISFTGSTAVGKTLAAQAAPHLKKLSLELGGNAPLIVFDDADLDLAADELLANKFRASGQTCVCTNRVLVHEAIAEDFTGRVVERVSQLKLGDGMKDDTDLGPLINRDGFDKVARHVDDAIEEGAHRIAGEPPQRPEHDWGAFYPPTVLTGVTPDMKIAREETFGPIVAIQRFATEDQAIRSGNDTEFGLAAYLFTADADRGHHVASALHFGHIGLNSATGPAPHAPFGGMKQSGFGREGGREGLREFCEIQVIAQGSPDSE